MYIVDFGGAGDDARQRREAERARVRAGHVGRLRDAGVAQAAAELAVATIFDHRRHDGSLCGCGCHPQLSAMHEDGTDCPCSWDEERRARARSQLTQWFDSPERQALARHHDAEQQRIAAWIASQQNVTAERIASYAPEQWEGTVDGRSFYFRERHDMWRLELDLEPNGRFVNKWVATDADGNPVTEPQELTEGTVIAEGVDTDLGDGPVAHLAFIVQTIRDHLWRESCRHAGALFYCPLSGERTTEPGSG